MFKMDSARAQAADRQIDVAHHFNRMAKRLLAKHMMAERAMVGNSSALPAFASTQGTPPPAVLPKAPPPAGPSFALPSLLPAPGPVRTYEELPMPAFTPGMRLQVIANVGGYLYCSMDGDVMSRTFVLRPSHSYTSYIMF